MENSLNNQFRKLLTVIFFFSFSLSFAQFNDYTVKLGLQANALLPDTEFDKENKPADPTSC
ncbi:MAG: hypothetical protein MUC75_04835 [Ignavibacteriaceae bacterium]|nr:hypothetical protein [Ignavibacteriaceae bacterium]